MPSETAFTKYHVKGSMHWDEMMSRKYNKFNAYQQARFETVVEWLGDIRGKTILDLGCGDGALTYLLAHAGGRVTGVDNEAEGLGFARQNFAKYSAHAECILADVRSTGLPPSSFDVVVSSDVIEHIERPEALVAEAARVLKTGGTFILTTPYRLKERPHPFHVKEFYPEELTSMLEPHFTAIEVKETHNVLWMALYDYPWKHFKRRQVWRYLINLATIYLHWNPFREDDSRRHKRDVFTQINIKCIKKNNAAI